MVCCNRLGVKRFECGLIVCYGVIDKFFDICGFYFFYYGGVLEYFKFFLFSVLYDTSNSSLYFRRLFRGLK